MSFHSSSPAGFRATSKQFGYFRSITGQSLPAGCSKSKASSLIKQALAGKIVPQKQLVKVYGWRFSGLAAECLKEELKGIFYAIDCDYRQVAGPYQSLAQAEAVARNMYPTAQIEVSDSIREQYMD
jgi:hypothetical protein